MFANLKKAAQDRDTVTIGGGDFHRGELLKAAHMLECFPYILKALEDLERTAGLPTTQDEPVRLQARKAIHMAKSED